MNHGSEAKIWETYWILTSGLGPVSNQLLKMEFIKGISTVLYVFLSSQQTIAHVFITHRLDHCNALHSGVREKGQG